MNSENSRVKHHPLVHFDHVTFTKVAHNLIDHGIPSRILICRSQYLPNGARRSLDRYLGSDGAIFMTCEDCANSREGNNGYDDRYTFYLFHGSLLIESGSEAFACEGRVPGNSNARYLARCWSAPPAATGRSRPLSAAAMASC